MALAIVILGFFILRGIAATIVFYFILPDGDRCPICDAQTLHVHSRFAARAIPGLRPSWCPDCGWDGMLRRPRQPVHGSIPPARLDSPVPEVRRS